MCHPNDGEEGYYSIAPEAEATGKSVHFGNLVNNVCGEF